MSVQAMSAVEKAQPAVEKKNAGLQATPRKIHLSESAQKDFLGPICGEYDRNIHAAMEIMQKIRKNNEKYCEQNGINLDVFIMVAFTLGERGAKDYFTGDKSGSDRMKDRLATYDYLNNLDKNDLNELFSKLGDVGMRLEKWSTSEDGKHIDTNMALALMVGWAMSRSKKSFEKPADAVEWYANELSKNSDAFSTFPGGIMGITIEAYDHLVAPESGGNKTIHREIMDGTTQKSQKRVGISDLVEPKDIMSSFRTTPQTPRTTESTLITDQPLTSERPSQEQVMQTLKVHEEAHRLNEMKAIALELQQKLDWNSEQPQTLSRDELTLMHKGLSSIEHAEGDKHKGELMSPILEMSFDDQKARLIALGAKYDGKGNYKKLHEDITGWVATDQERSAATMAEAPAPEQQKQAHASVSSHRIPLNAGGLSISQPARNRFGGRGLNGVGRSSSAQETTVQEPQPVTQPVAEPAPKSVQEETVVVTHTPVDKAAIDAEAKVILEQIVNVNDPRYNTVKKGIDVLAEKSLKESDTSLFDSLHDPSKSSDSKKEKLFYIGDRYGAMPDSLTYSRAVAIMNAP